MKSVARIFFFLSLTLPLASCGKFFGQFDRLKEGFTRITVNHDNGGRVPNDMQLGFQGPKQIANSILGGGIIVWAYDTLGNRTYSGTLSDETGSLQMTLPNSTYAFYGFGWPTANLTDTTSGPTQGVRCGSAPNMTLSGVAPAAPITISLADSSACYYNGFFTPTAMQATSPIPTINTLNVEFCNSATSFSGFTSSSTCSGQFGSSNFFAGTSATDVGRAIFFPGTKTLVFEASHDKGTGSPPNQPYELYATDTTNGSQHKVALPITSGYGIKTIAGNANKNKAFVIVKNSTGSNSLWAYDITTKVATQISQTPIGGAAGVQDVRVSPDGNWVVWVGDMDAVGVFELYANPTGTDGSNSYQTTGTKISGTGVTGAGVYQQCTGCDMNSYDFQISQNSKYVVYSSQNVTSTANKMYIATLDNSGFTNVNLGGSNVGAQSSGFNISSTEVSSATDYIDYVGTTFDGSQLLYHAHATSTDKIYVRSVSYNASTGALVVSAPSTLVTTGATGPYYVTANSHNMAAVFSAVSTTYTASLVPDLTVPGTIYTMINNNMSTVTSPGFGKGAFTSTDADFVVGFTGVPSTTTVGVDVWSSHTNLVTNLGGNPFSYVSGPLASPKQVTATGGDGRSLFQLSADGSSLVIVADQATAGIAKVQKGVFGTGTPTVTDVSDPRVTTAATTVTSAGFDGSGNIYYTANLDATTTQLWQAPGSSPFNATALNSPAAGISVAKQIGGGDDMKTGSTKLVVLGTTSTFPSIKQAWLYDTSTGSYLKMISLGQTGTSPDGVGSFRISMLQTQDGGTTYTTAFDSGCLGLNANAADGTQMNTSVRLPAGTSATAPFATRVDVYPLAVGCSGTPISYNFPNGIGTALGSTSGAALFGTSSISTLFLNDKN